MVAELMARQELFCAGKLPHQNWTRPPAPPCEFTLGDNEEGRRSECTPIASECNWREARDVIKRWKDALDLRRRELGPASRTLHDMHKCHWDTY